MESLLNKTIRITNARNAKTLSPSHMKQCIMSENRFDFLRELVKNIPDINVSEDLSSSECTSPGSPNQLEINLQPQEPIQISLSTAAVAAAAATTAFKPNINNNTNGNNLVRNGHRGMLHSKSVDHQQQQNWDNSIYSTNRPFNNLGNYSEDGINQPTTSQAKIIGPNFYTEISSTNLEEQDCVKPPKFSRLDSAPSIMSSSTSSSQLKSKNSELLLPLNLTKTATTGATTYNDFTKLTVKTNKRRTDPPPQLTPIIKTKTIRNNNSIDFSVPSTSKNIPSPPVIKLDICNSPVVKIDYSNLALSSTFGQNNILPSPNVVASTYNQSPIINIDFSNINNFSFNNTKTTAVLNQQMPSNPTTISTPLEMDEDYDNI